MKKRLIATSLFFALAVTTLFSCSCLSSEQQQIADENESISRTIAEEYLKSNYDGGTVNSLSCITYTPKESTLGSRKASSYVRASATSNDKNFYILVNTESKECLDNYNSESVKEIIEERAAAVLPSETPYDITTEIYSKAITEELGSSDYEGYLSSADKTAEDIFSDNDYSIKVTCSYIASDADFSAIDTSAFLPEGSNLDNVTLTYMNYKDESRFRSGGEDSYKLNSCFTSVITGKDAPPQTTYSSYSSYTDDDVEIAWDTTKIDINVKKADSSQETDITSEDYPELLFNPKNEYYLEIEYKMLDETADSGNIDFYLDGKNYGDYGVLTDKQNTFNKHTIWHINGSKSGNTFVPFSFGHTEGKFELGIYTGEESNKLADIVNGFGGQK